ncbi:MAG: hypothetical protein KBD27_02985 [Candidatus Moranbacteria bacterium]|nr:hypothetical protein [Candidatus Moranbacteria bacterium]
MGRIAAYGVLVALAIVVTASYGSEISREILDRFRENPDQACELIHPIDDIVNALTIPIGAQHKQEIVWRKEVPDGFHAVLALMQVVSVAPCQFAPNQEAKLFVRAIRLIEYDPVAKTERVVSEVNDFSKQEETLFVGKLFQRLPHWYDGQMSEPSASMLSLEEGALVIDLTQTPQFIYHGWTEPQVEAKPGMNYLVEMEVKMVGPVRLQMGIDYWRFIGAENIGWNADCSRTNNCEGHLSRWFGPTDDWQTLRTPDALAK